MSTTQQDHDERLLNLAHAIARAYKYNSSGTIKDVAPHWLNDWEEFMGKEYIDGADIEWYDKRIHILLQLLATYSCHNPERKHILAALASNIDCYADVVAHCPSGYFSKDIAERVHTITENIK
jgi:hypothetical protein